MRVWHRIGIVGLAGWLTSAAQGGTDLSIRLVEASNRGGPTPPGLNDVSEVLKANLGFNTCVFVASSWVRLPADRQVSRLGDYAVTCSGSQKNLTIIVQRGQQRLLKTSVAILDDKPLILGGFPSAAGKHVLVFLLR